jgi:hypothetical protein
MSTMAAFYSRSPFAGGTLVGTVGCDGHPNNMKRLANAKNYKAYRAALRAIKAREGRYWWTPKRAWWTWPSSGLFVQDYSYWWDDDQQAVMFAHYQFGPKLLTPETAMDHEQWPTSDDLNQLLIGVPLPESFATVDPWDIPTDVPLHCRTAAHDWNGEPAERLFAGFDGRDLTLERSANTISTGRTDFPAGFHVYDETGEKVASANHVTQAVRAFAYHRQIHRQPGSLGPKDTSDGRNCYFLYSVEDFLRECRFGPVRISRRNHGQLFQVEATHPVAGFVRSDADTLAKALVLARRQVVTAPGFRLNGVPPFNLVHVGNDPEPPKADEDAA